MEQPVVAHAIRGYLAPTETFVGNQITSLREYRPVVVAHHRSPNREFDIDDMFVMEEQRGTLGRLAGPLAYGALKQVMPAERERAIAWLARFRPVLWHFHFAVDAAFFLPLFRAMGLPAVVSLYGYDISSFPNKAGGLGHRYISRIFHEMDCFLAMSNDMRRDAIMLGIPEERIVVHYHGINAQRFRYDERSYEKKNQFNILCVGTLEPKKGQHHLVRALAAIRASRPDINAHLTLVGRGPLQAEVERLIRQHGLERHVEMAGYVPHLDPAFIRYYHDADVFVHFSTTQPDRDKEGIPGTIVEAMAAGLPVVTTRHAGIPEIITDGVDGMLLEENDAAGIARCILQLHDDESLRGRLGRNAARRALHDLDVRTKSSRLEQIYASVACLPTHERKSGSHKQSFALREKNPG